MIGARANGKALTLTPSVHLHGTTEQLKGDLLHYSYTSYEDHINRSAQICLAIGKGDVPIRSTT